MCSLSWLKDSPFFARLTMTSKAPAACDDPRKEGFPCFKEHKPGKLRSNQFASWVTCAKCGLRLSYNTKKMGTGGSRQMGPDPNVIRISLADLEKTRAATEITEGIVNGKILEVKGKMLQMGMKTSTSVNVTLEEYQKRLIEHGRQDEVPVTTDLLETLPEKPKTNPLPAGQRTIEQALNLHGPSEASEITAVKKLSRELIQQAEQEARAAGRFTRYPAHLQPIDLTADDEKMSEQRGKGSSES